MQAVLVREKRLLRLAIRILEERVELPMNLRSERPRASVGFKGI
jgi:3-deoxy-D-arabino-heptulosonate 7-phosphate (DAHP) synthase